MALPDKSIDGKILNAARQEFLEHGYRGASLRAICSRAGVTTGALYNRYSGKEELFRALVQPFQDYLTGLFSQLERKTGELVDASDLSSIWHSSPEEMRAVMNLFYEHLTEFRLLLTGADGSPYEGFFHRLIDWETDCTCRIMQTAFRRGLTARMPDRDELHLLLTAFFSAVVEPALHAWPLEKALACCDSVCLLFNWPAVFGL